MIDWLVKECVSFIYQIWMCVIFTCGETLSRKFVEVAHTLTTVHFHGTHEGFTDCLQLVGSVWEERNYKTMILWLCLGLVKHQSLTAEICVCILGQSLWEWWQTKWHWNRFFSEWFRFPMLVSFHQCIILLFNSSSHWHCIIFAVDSIIQQNALCLFHHRFLWWDAHLLVWLQCISHKSKANKIFLSPSLTLQFSLVGLMVSEFLVWL